MGWSVQVHSKCVSFNLSSFFCHDNGTVAPEAKGLVGVGQQLPCSWVCLLGEDLWISHQAFQAWPRWFLCWKHHMCWKIFSITLSSGFAGHQSALSVVGRPSMTSI